MLPGLEIRGIPSFIRLTRALLTQAGSQGLTLRLLFIYPSPEYHFKRWLLKYDTNLCCCGNAGWNVQGGSLTRTLNKRWSSGAGAKRGGGGVKIGGQRPNGLIKGERRCRGVEVRIQPALFKGLVTEVN